MGNVKRHNRTLPLHPEHHPELIPEIHFFERLIKREVDKAFHQTEIHGQVYYYPTNTTKLGEKILRAH